MSEERVAKCNGCGFSGALDEFDVFGACPGNLFCNNCGTEFNGSTGEPALLCGNCFGCESLKQDGEFEDAQRQRRLNVEAAPS